MLWSALYLQKELSPILKGHLFIEKVLETLISRNLVEPKTFSDLPVLMI
jgi:hypothetical protein